MARAARRVTDGEPKNRMVARIGERTYELDEPPVLAPGESMTVELRRDRIAIAAATALARAGCELAERGELDRALEKWRGASAIDPHDPDPHYQSGVVLLGLGRFAEAAATFERTDAVAPGWFLCRHYRWLAREIAEGRLEAWAAEADRGSPDDRGRGARPPNHSVKRALVVGSITATWVMRWPGVG